MKKFRPEFGNPDHIALLERERKENELEKQRDEAFAKALEQREVGYQIVEIETCGECGEETENYWYERVHENKNYILCKSCDSILESHFIF